MDKVEIFAIKLTDISEVNKNDLYWKSNAYNQVKAAAELTIKHLSSYLESLLTKTQKKNVVLEIEFICRNEAEVQLGLMMQLTNLDLFNKNYFIDLMQENARSFISSINSKSNEIKSINKAEKVSLSCTPKNDQLEPEVNKKETSKNRAVNQLMLKANNSFKVDCFIGGEEITIEEIPNHTYTSKSASNVEAIVQVSGVIDDKEICRLVTQQIDSSKRKKILELQFSNEQRNTLLEAQLSGTTLKISYTPNLYVKNGISGEKGGTLVGFGECDALEFDFGDLGSM